MLRASVDNSTNCLRQGLGVVRRLRDTCIDNEVGAIPNVGHDTRNAFRFKAQFRLSECDAWQEALDLRKNSSYRSEE